MRIVLFDKETCIRISKAVERVDLHPQLVLMSNSYFTFYLKDDYFNNVLEVKQRDDGWFEVYDPAIDEYYLIPMYFVKKVIKDDY